MFLDSLKSEFETIKSMPEGIKRKNALYAFQNKLASLKFLDPACGSGNFLTETYISLRCLENDVLREISSQIVLGDEIVKVSIKQFYGIEINDFAVSVAKAALWIAELQMLKETMDIVHSDLDFLPLKTNVHIVEGNALRLDWESVVPKNELNYIIGNPPFGGSSNKNVANKQKKDKESVFGSAKAGKLDYVACWYKKANDYIANTHIEVAFVSTNSITQGEQVRPLWENLIASGLKINFAYRTFKWDSEANEKAHVHCVIICVSRKSRKNKFIETNGVRKSASNINGYLVDAPDFYIESRNTAPCGMPKLTQGNKPWDGGGLILSEGEKDYFITKYPELAPSIRLFLGSKEYINNIKRYCFWFENISPSVYRQIPEIKERLRIVSDTRAASPTEAVKKQADTPTIFSQIRQPKSDYILIPETSSAARKYIPMGFMPKEVISSNSVMTAANATLFMFGVLESKLHMLWVRTLCGRLKSDYRYSPSLYNNFPWCTPTAEQKSKIEQTAQAILEARALYPDSSLADLYDELTMPLELRKAHQDNDRAVMSAYGLPKNASEEEIVAFLFKMYRELTVKNE